MLSPQAKLDRFQHGVHIDQDERHELVLAVVRDLTCHDHPGHHARESLREVGVCLELGIREQIKLSL